MNFTKRAPGFTLMEVLITLVIVGILASISIPSYNSYITKSKIRSAQADLIALSLVLENFYQLKLMYPKDKNLEDTASIQKLFSSWSAASEKDFSFTLVSSTSTYSITASGTSSSVSGCTLIIKNSEKTISGCSGIDSW
ncbi:type IV pilus assembly protein PilE [Azomonas agilis]|uniref:Type IV pilus assembly protein PilE n=1 Tax=Azomonas agilis TaxID=116849 RepID=A0A562IZN8_9GAMM|nr:type IV pilin protein [Azomonas agilis]TWH76323.1 type IV pilus assembly protein PilE [Azomonas agilis]